MFGSCARSPSCALMTTPAFAPAGASGRPAGAAGRCGQDDPVLKQDQDARRDHPRLRGRRELHAAGRSAPRVRGRGVPEARRQPVARRAHGSPRAGSRRHARKAKRGSELRPDLPWLDKLEMPDLPVTWTPRLIEYLVFYKDDPRGRSIMTSWLEAQGRYRDLIVSHLRAAHLPEDLLYDSMIESSYEPGRFVDRGRARHLAVHAQGGKIYGLREDHWVDERKRSGARDDRADGLLRRSLPALRRLGDGARGVQRRLRRRAALDRPLQHERLLPAVRVRERSALGDLPLHAQGARGGDRRAQPRACSATTRSRSRSPRRGTRSRCRRRCRSR